jgi:hypothetical protein
VFDLGGMNYEGRSDFDSTGAEEAILIETSNLTSALGARYIARL